MRILPFVPSLCVLGMATVFIGLGLNSERSAARLEAEGSSYSGTINQAEIQRGAKGKKRYVLRINWGEGAQAKTNDPFVVTKAFYQSRIGPDGIAIDPAVTLRALSGELDSAVVVGGSSDLSGMQWLGIFVAAIGGLMLLRTFFRVSKASRPVGG